MRKLFPAVLIACSLASPLAYAQAPKNTPANEAAPVAAAGKWRASKVIGVNVYNNANEKVGEISEIIIDSAGKVESAVLSVGGFLGMGEHLVAVPMNELKFANEAGKTTTGSTSSNTKEWYPDRAVLNVTKDQLKSMPQFKY
ncbi:MAG: PRC-barrel domain containing protein [Rhizobium sp.]|nr:MAG: PRC-barrel domain containing protein [Rhizobium sp.]